MTILKMENGKNTALTSKYLKRAIQKRTTLKNDNSEQGKLKKSNYGKDISGKDNFEKGHF